MTRSELEQHQRSSAIHEDIKDIMRQSLGSLNTKPRHTWRADACEYNQWYAYENTTDNLLLLEE
jgi:DNA recombination-dependent growth factor C